MAYGLFVGFVVYRTLTLKDLYELLVDACASSAVVMLVVAFAGIFGWAMMVLGVVERVSEGVIAMSSNPFVVIALINVILIISGMLLDAISIYYLLMPIFMPVIAHFGWDPVWFGVVMTINLAIGQVTPPWRSTCTLAAMWRGSPWTKYPGRWFPSFWLLSRPWR